MDDFRTLFSLSLSHTIITYTHPVVVQTLFLPLSLFRALSPSLSLFWALSLSRSLSFDHSRFQSISLALTLTFALFSLPLSHTQTPSIFYKHTHIFFTFSLFLSLPKTHYLSLCLSLSLSIYLFNTYTYTHITHTLSLSILHRRAHTMPHYLSLYCNNSNMNSFCQLVFFVLSFLLDRTWLLLKYLLVLNSNWYIFLQMKIEFVKTWFFPIKRCSRASFVGR